MANSTKKKKSPSDRIKKAALDLFCQFGFESVSVRDIALKANINVSMISYYFNSKENLYQALFKDYFKVENDFYDVDNPLEQLLNLIDFYLKTNCSNWQLFNIICQEAGKSNNSLLSTEIFCLKESYKNIFSKILNKGFSANIFTIHNSYYIFDLLIGSANQFLFEQISQYKSSGNKNELVIDYKPFFDFQKKIIENILIKNAS